MTSLRNPIMQRIRRKQTKLNLHGSNGMHRVCLADRSRADLTQTDTPNLPLGNEFPERLHGGLDGDVGVDPGELKDVDGLDAVEHAEGVVDGGADASGASVGPGTGVVGAFDAEADFGGV